MRPLAELGALRPTLELLLPHFRPRQPLLQLHDICRQRREGRLSGDRALAGGGRRRCFLALDHENARSPAAGPEPITQHLP